MWRSAWLLITVEIAIVVRGWTVQHPFSKTMERTKKKTIPSSSTFLFVKHRQDATDNSSNAATVGTETAQDDEDDDDGGGGVFEDFVKFLLEKQSQIITELERYEEGSAKFTRDTWGIFDEEGTTTTTTTTTTGRSGGITRVIRGGNIIEKGACSLTVIRRGTLSADRAATIRARRDISIREGDGYAAAALSMVLHSRSPHVPTFRSDVRVFCVATTITTTTTTTTTTATGDGNNNTQQQKTLAWFGGGAGKEMESVCEILKESFRASRKLTTFFFCKDLTPYFLYDDDISFFHGMYRDLCEKQGDEEMFSYDVMKKACDDYFYLPARSEHRGTGGIFFDDMIMNAKSLSFVQGVTDTWMPSWLPIVQRRQGTPVSDRQRQWQLLRRGRYLEFNLLYDRGVKFGLANANPRVEGVMVSAPPLIAFEYNHVVEPDSEEDRLLQVLKQPKEWL